MKSLKFCFLLVPFFLGFNVISQNFEDVKIETYKLSDQVYILTGSGGNIGVCIGEDGVFVIDDQYASLTPKIVAAIKTLSDKPIKFLANTHHHGDHTGGNANMQELGATILAHENVRKHLKETPQGANSMASENALPVITYMIK